MTNRELLIWLHKFQQYRRFAHKPDGDWYRAEGYFRKQPADWTPLMRRDNRRTTLRLANQPSCIRCQEPLGPNSMGDHIIPTSKGGPEGAENYLPLCGRHNSSKQDRDLLDWWVIHQQQAVGALPDDVICSYARLMFTWHDDRGSLDEEVAAVALPVVQQIVEYTLPPEAARYFAGLAGYSPLLGGFLSS